MMYVLIMGKDALPQGKEAKAGGSRSASNSGSEKHLEMVEGPEAFSRLQTAMKTILSGRGVSARDPDARPPS